MNIIDLQESLKANSAYNIFKAYSQPINDIPQYLILTELQRRKRMRDDYNRQEAKDMQTVAEEMITGAGVPQEGLMTLASALTPNTALSQDTGIDQATPMQATRAPQPQMAADGGTLKMAEGGITALLDGVFGFGRGKEDIGKPVQPYPDNSPNPRDRSTWMRMYGETHNLDGSPKTMSPNISEINKPTDYKSPFVSDVSADIGDFTPNPISSEMDQLVNQGKSPNLNNISRVGSLPFLPSGSLGIGADTDTEDLLETMLKANEGIARDELPESADSDLRFSRGTASTNALKDAVVGSGISSRSIDPSSVVGNLPFLPLPTGNAYSELPIRGADTDPAQQLAAFLASRRSDLPGVNLPGESYPYEIDPDAAEKQGQAILDSLTPPSTEIQDSAPDRSIDRQINPEKYMDLDDFLAQDSIRDRSSDRGSSLQYPTFLPYPTASGAFPNDAELAGQYPQRGGSETVTERQRRLGEEYGFPYKVPPPLREFIDTFKSEPEEKIAPKADEDRRGDPELTITEPTTISEDAETSAAEAMRLQEESFDQPDPLSVLDSITDGGAGGAGFGSAESEIAKMISDRRKRADQNKWLALAEAGFAMMGPAATLGEGISRGGRAGLKAMRDSQKGMDAFESDMLKLQTQLDIAQQKSADTRYGADTRAGTARYTADKGFAATELSTEARNLATKQRLNAATGNQLKDMIDIYDSQLAELGIIPGAEIPPEKMDAYNNITSQKQATINELQRRTGLDVAATGGAELSGQFNVI